MINILDLIGRQNELFEEDIAAHEDELSTLIQNSSFLILGAAGSIGQAVTKEIFKRNPQKIVIPRRPSDVPTATCFQSRAAARDRPCERIASTRSSDSETSP